LLLSSLISRVVLSHSNARIDDRHELQGLIVIQIIDIGLKVAKVKLINYEVLIVVHVVDVSPLSIKGDIVFLVIINNLLVLIDSAEAVFALMPSEGPLRHQNWLANDTLVVGNNGIWGF